jgi:hypothetical protein
MKERDNHIMVDDNNDIKVSIEIDCYDANRQIDALINKLQQVKTLLDDINGYEEQ